MLYSQTIDLGKFYGAKEVFQHVNLEVRQGDRIGIVGPNGAGKTTFFRIFCGLLEADQGNIAHTSGIRIGYLEQFQNWPDGATHFRHPNRLLRAISKLA
jgi:ATPase components of ABC transporters with duplicated ATPase domains